jgi:putative ABC transport system ATP-binding protein
LLRKKTNAAIFSSYYAECLKKCSDKKIAKILEKKIEVIKTDYGNKSIVIRENIDNFINIRKVKIIHLLEKTKKYFPSAETNPENIVELRNVKKYYCNENVAFNILNNINLQIQKGKFIVILGSSGSGKTTLMNIISGMDNSTYGQVVVNNIDITNMNAAQLTDFRRKNIGYIFQQYGLLPNLTVKENVEIGYSLQPDKSQRLDIDEILKSVEMYDYKNKMPHELSGGQQQRVSIARSIVKNPAIIFGDEPTGAVDEKMSKMIMELFIKVNKEYKTTVIIVTHNHIIAELADIVIYVGHGSIEKVVYNEHPKNPNELK